MSIRLLALSLAAAVAACSSTPVEHDDASGFPSEPLGPIAEARLQGRIENIQYQRGVALVHNLERIVAYGEAAIPALLQGLESEEPMTRMGCAYALGRIGQTSTIPALEARLQDEVPYVRYEAASALGAMGSRAGYGVLVAGLSDEEIEFRYKCFEALQDFTGQTFGYSHMADPEVRKVAVDRWQEWLRGVQSEEL